jgi:hypothetical protein
MEGFHVIFFLQIYEKWTNIQVRYQANLEDQGSSENANIYMDNVTK